MDRLIGSQKSNNNRSTNYSSPGGTGKQQQIVDGGAAEISLVHDFMMCDFVANAKLS